MPKRAAVQNEAPTAETEEPPRRPAILFVVISCILIALILFGSLFYVRWHRDKVAQENSYNGFDFTLLEQGSSLWVTHLTVKGQPYVVPFYYHPRDTESVLMEQGITDRFFTRPPSVIYLTFHPDGSAEEVIAGVEISRLLGYKYDLFNIETHGALQFRPDSSAERIILTCANATRETAILFFERGDKDYIYADEKNPWCIHLQYTSANESIRVADRFAYGLVRIMPG